MSDTVYVDRKAMREEFGFSPAVIRRIFDRLPVTRVTDRKLLVRRSDLLAYLAEREEGVAR